MLRSLCVGVEYNGEMPHSAGESYFYSPLGLGRAAASASADSFSFGTVCSTVIVARMRCNVQRPSPIVSAGTDIPMDAVVVVVC